MAIYNITNLSTMKKNFESLRQAIRRKIISEGGYYIGSNGEVLPEPGYKYHTEDEPFTPDTKDLSIPMLKYYLDELPADLKQVLNAPDAQILDEPDLPEGIYTVYSKSLKKSFNFSYKNDSTKDWSVFVN